MPASNATSGERSSEGMGGLAKGLAIIEALATHGMLSVSDAARASNITRAAARRCLITLTELGYVEQSGREFRPLPRLRKLGGAITRRDQMARLAEPLLARARDELSESVSLAVLDNDKPLFIARAEAEHILSTGVRVGAHLPVYCSATGRVLLSQFSDEEITQRLGRKSFHQRTPHTIVKPTALLAEIQAVRKRAYAISDEELELGMRALAVPVFGENREIVAAISVSAASARVRAADLRHHFLPVLQSCSKTLSEAIGKAD
ncbi:IclR family transcriptional regulator domain-containing protein [Bradyrhizobium canariense]|uniref:Transcriptional regulator, IclR family n=1 Tax=Bradyrhizobium canariense TaxID=255045 RepID=A0A1H2BM24_9BRAD|nr:IclR family transcriptional regulator C-terminal domain-containing protein [Bradyrhizobium canariense]SDT59238.1 transcriptional regulator, IclR family [Bradyrhizobium canariense]